MLRHPGASAVVPFLDDAARAPIPRVLLIRQFRHAADGFIWEVPAGRLDAGESPEACARRELEEETGMRAGGWSGSPRSTPRPGFTDERIHLFLAQGLEPGAEHREADEFMELHTLRWSEVLQLVRARVRSWTGRRCVSLLFVQCFPSIAVRRLRHLPDPTRPARDAARLAARHAGGVWDRFADWFNAFHFNENTILLGFAVAIGLAGGLGVVAFYRLIDLAYWVLYLTPAVFLTQSGILAYRPLLTGSG